MTRYERIYGRLLRLYPDEFRGRYGAEMTQLFADQLRDATASGQPLAAVTLWARSVADLLVTVPGQHLEKEVPVPQPANVAAADLSIGPSRWQHPVARRLLGLLPLWVLLVEIVVAPAMLQPLLDNQPGIIGLPAGLLLLAPTFAVMAMGVVLLRRASSIWSAVLAFVGLTLPSTVSNVMAPAIVLALPTG
jgi:hypothetical protein